MARIGQVRFGYSQRATASTKLATTSTCRLNCQTLVRRKRNPLSWNRIYTSRASMPLVTNRLTIKLSGNNPKLRPLNNLKTPSAVLCQLATVAGNVWWLMMKVWSNPGTLAKSIWFQSPPVWFKNKRVGVMTTKLSWGKASAKPEGSISWGEKKAISGGKEVK